MNLENISKSTPIEPEINADGWYAQCVRCWHEITPQIKYVQNVNKHRIGLGLVKQKSKEEPV